MCFANDGYYNLMNSLLFDMLEGNKITKSKMESNGKHKFPRDKTIPNTP